MIDNSIKSKNLYKPFFDIQNIGSISFVKYNSSNFFKKPDLLILIA